MYIYIYTFQLSAASTIKLEHVGICFGPRTSTESPKILSSKSVLISQVLRVVAHLRSRSRNHLFQRIQLLSIANKAVFRPVVWVGKVSYPLESFGSGFLCQEWCFDLSIYLHYTPWSSTKMGGVISKAWQVCGVTQVAGGLGRIFSQERLFIDTSWHPFLQVIDL